MGYGEEMLYGEELLDDFSDREHDYEFIEMDRKRRLKELVGKYVIITDGISTGKKVFLQDKRIDDGGYWTQYLSNAYGFDSIRYAEASKRKFKYNNPRVAIVQPNGAYKLI